MFREEKILHRLSTLLILALSITLYFGQSETIHVVLSFLGLDSSEAIAFVENLFIVEHAMIPARFDQYMGIAGYVLTSIMIFLAVLMRRPKRKHVAFTGVALVIMGFVVMFVLDISVIGWLCGSMMMISGFLTYKKSRLFL